MPSINTTTWASLQPGSVIVMDGEFELLLSVGQQTEANSMAVSTLIMTGPNSGKVLIWAVNWYGQAKVVDT